MEPHRLAEGLQYDQKPTVVAGKLAGSWGSAMSLMDMDTLMAAFNAHKQGQTKFTRRMAINLAHMDGTTPKQLVLRCERLGLLKRGSWDWFAANGGITQDQIREVRGAA